MFVGASIGLYAPVLMYGRNYDCFSYFLKSGLTAITYARYADYSPTDLTSVGMAIVTVTSDFWNAYKTISVCSAQLNGVSQTNWYSHYLLK